MDTKKLRQKILDLAIRGKLVPQDPSDEPASVLLGRIRAEKERLVKEGKIKRSKKTASDDEIEAPFEIPESWIACKLEDIAYIGTGATPDTRNNDYYNGNIPWVSSSCTKYDYIDTPTSYITQKAIDETNCRIYPKGTLIMAMYGEGKTRGQISELKIDAAINQACAAIVPYNLSTPQYIKLYLKRSYLHIREQAEGGTQPNLNLSKIAQYDISLPPLSEQNRIVNAVERWFTLIDELESNEGDLLKAIDKAKSKILDLAIHGKLVPQDPNDEPAIELLKRINPKFEPCDTLLAILPNGWTYCRLEEIMDYEQPQAYIVQSTDYKPQYTVPVLTAGKSFIIGYTNEEEGICSNLPVIIFDDFTTDSRYVDFPFKVKSSAMKILHVKEGVNIQYVCHFMSVTRLIGDTHKRYWISEYSKLAIPLPPYQEQLRIVAKIEELFAVLDSIKESLE